MTSVSFEMFQKCIQNTALLDIRQLERQLLDKKFEANLSSIETIKMSIEEALDKLFNYYTANENLKEPEVMMVIGKDYLLCKNSELSTISCLPAIVPSLNKYTDNWKWYQSLYIPMVETWVNSSIKYINILSLPLIEPVDFYQNLPKAEAILRAKIDSIFYTALIYGHRVVIVHDFCTEYTDDLFIIYIKLFKKLLQKHKYNVIMKIIFIFSNPRHLDLLNKI